MQTIYQRLSYRLIDQLASHGVEKTSGGDAKRLTCVLNRSVARDVVVVVIVELYATARRIS